jgi:glycosyltransferase involved in cell wall biosynthesis
LTPNCVSFLGSRMDIPNLLSAIDIFVLCSETEGLPVSLIEAMAAKKPIIATSVGGIPQLIENDHNGLLISPHDPSRLAKSILALMENSTLRESIAQEAFQTIESKFSTDVVGQKIIAIYNNLLDKKFTSYTSIIGK